jgi:hypothetical protein
MTRREINLRLILIGVCLAAVLRVAPAAPAAPATQPTVQLPIDRVDLMPNRPTPFKLKDFKAAARGLDKLLFDFDARGDHLPLIWWDDTKINVPMRGFGFPSFVGRPSQSGGSNHESITTMGALLGATLAGIDKSREPGGHNWVEMTQVYFNTRNGQNVVLNNVDTETGNTYWYETFPQILFNCLIDRYPGTPRGTEIMRTACDRWYQAYQALAARPGGLNFDHTAFSLSKMQPFDNGRWREPDGAEGLAWILFSAYRKFGDEKYLAAAKELMACIDRRDTNPHYEINHLWGTYLAARLNAEHDTNYDVGRFINWCFNPSENRPGWGVGIGRWGKYECSGLACGVNDGGGYAFLMNTYVLGGTIVPLVRYDERYAAAVGKWMLNAMNAARLFYPDALPADMQSCPGWKSDPPNVVAYEGLRRRGPKGQSPYACGDAVRFKWGNTDFGIYGSGFVGMFAAMITPPVPGDDPMIPRLDLLACDFFRDKAYPSYLYYNPYDDPREVSVAVGDSAVDVYDAVRNSFLARGVTGATKVPLDPNAAAVFVLVPAGGKESFQGRKTLVDGVVIDFDNGREPRPQPARRDAPTDQSKTVAADRATIVVDGDPGDWAKLDGESMNLNTGGRGKLEVTLRFAWDDQFLYALVKQTAKGEKVHEVSDAAAYAYAPWDSDGVWLHIDIANGRLPSVGDLILAMSLNSSRAANVFDAGALSVGGTDATQLRTATSGSADAGDRVIEARVPWAELARYATNERAPLAERLGPIRSGFRFGCEPMLVEFNHTRQSFVGGAQYVRPNGRDANSRDIVLRNGGGARP